MGDIISTHTDFERFVLKSENNDSLILIKEPDGWDEDTIEYKRNTKYHGIFTNYANTLTFHGEAMDYIENAYLVGGINADLRLLKYVLVDVDGDVKWKRQYIFLADFKTKVVKDDSLKINFNSNELEDIIKSHESDTFEIERLDSIDSEDVDDLDALELHEVELSGRTITGIGKQVLYLEDEEGTGLGTLPSQEILNDTEAVWETEVNRTAITTSITVAGERHVTVDSNDEGVASRMFFVPVAEQGATSNIEIDYDINAVADFLGKNHLGETATLEVFFQVLQWNEEEAKEDSDYTLIEEDSIGLLEFVTSPQGVGRSEWYSEYIEPKELSISGKAEYTLEYNQGISIIFRATKSQKSRMNILVSKHDVSIVNHAFYESTPNLNFTFYHDCIERLLYIMTGEQKKFYSSFFGRTERAHDLGYENDGFGGLIGLMSGFWARAFDPTAEKYKSLQISLSDAIKAAQAVFNVGVGIETVDFVQRLRMEELEYFYQNEVVVKLPFQVNDVTRKIDKNLFFSGTEMGFDKGGEYENEVGLDEPNTRTTTVTPIRKSTKKFRKISKIRSDDYGLELTRRKPYADFSEDSTGGDEDNWFLDLKRNEFETGYEQQTWSDRLQSEPTGVNSPDDYKGMLFTPLRMLFRHGFVLRSGMEPYQDKYIKYASSKANTTLEMHFENEDKAYKENSNILVSDLDRSRFLPEIIECSHIVDDDLLAWIRGTTSIKINGKDEEVPNVYFKFEFINEKGLTERGYLLSLKPQGDGKFVFQKSNDNII